VCCILQGNSCGAYFDFSMNLRLPLFNFRNDDFIEISISKMARPPQA
jgi:hypothetical protein